MNNYYTLEEILSPNCVNDDHCSRHCESCSEGQLGIIDYLKQIIESDILDDLALGITKQILGKGFDSLSEKQAFVFERDVLKPYTRKSCKGLNNDYKNCQGEPLSLWEDNV
jgi:hypothetical protein